MRKTPYSAMARALAVAVGLTLAADWLDDRRCRGQEAKSNSACCASNGDCDERRIPDCCEPRKTLLQWSYGTSFEGGPAGFDEPLVTDRPDFTEASVTVGRGVAQVEMGYTFVFDRAGGESVRTHSFPEMLWRVGVLAEWLELRIAYNFIEEHTRTGGLSTTVSGSDDLYVGLKLALTPQEGILPEMAIIPQMTVPSGDADIGAGEVLPGVNWLYGWDVNDFLATGGSTQINRTLDELTGEPYYEVAQSWTIGYGLTERLGAYTEWFAFFPSGADTALPQHFFNGGFTFLVSNNIQLDVRAGVGLNDAADDYFAGSGASIRF